MDAISAMAEKNKGTVAVYLPDIGIIKRIKHEEYEERKARGMAFHSTHPVTQLFKQNIELKKQLEEYSAHG